MELAELRSLGFFRNIPGLEGKYFTTSYDAARSYGDMATSAFGDPPYTVVSTQMPNSVLNTLTPVTVDGGIPAYVVPTQNLTGLVPKIH